MFSVQADPNVVAALLAVQVAFFLYGAGIRRPLGSLSTVKELPSWLRNARALTLVVDCIFWVLVAYAWYFFLQHIKFLDFIILIVCFSVIGHYLSHRISLIPSFFISFVLGLVALVLVIKGSEITFIH